jgi:hypothetical protein
VAPSRLPPGLSEARPGKSEDSPEWGTPLRDRLAGWLARGGFFSAQKQSAPG